MDFLTNLNMSADWGLGLGDQANGLFGDLEDFCHPKGDMDPAYKPRDAVQQVVLSPQTPEPLGLDWMESGDLVSFLDALDKGQVGLSTPQDNLLDCSPSLDVTDVTSVVQTTPYFLDTGMEVNVFDQGLTLTSLTPPDSPEQVTPVITFPIESEVITFPIESDNLVSIDTSLASSEPFTISIQDSSPPLLPIVDFQTDFLVDTDESLFDLQLIAPEIDTKEGIDLVYSSDHVLNSSASSSRSSTPKPNIETLIESSPELYKVIATPVSSRFSPYPKVKVEQKAKSSCKSKSKKSALNLIDTDLDLIPEEIITGHLGKRERKKLQNKNAAIRYRQKKKAEVEVISGEVEDLEKRNGDLKSKVDDIQREIRYMKNLMEDIYKAKGLIVK